MSHVTCQVGVVAQVSPSMPLLLCYTSLSLTSLLVVRTMSHAAVVYSTRHSCTLQSAQ
jgi:hypothetical protein